jgi:hypothetical protein
MSDNQEVAPTLSQSQFLRIAFDALSVRAARWVTLGMSFGLFAAALYRPSWIRAVLVVSFTILVHLPMWFKREKAHG